jgi:hypothetical protein
MGFKPGSRENKYYVNYKDPHSTIPTTIICQLRYRIVEDEVLHLGAGFRLASNTCATQECRGRSPLPGRGVSPLLPLHAAAGGRPEK